MPATKPTKPAAQSRMVSRQMIDDPNRAAQVLSDAVSAVESKVGQLQKLMTKEPPTVKGSKGGNAALASLITALAALGLVKDATT